MSDERYEFKIKVIALDQGCIMAGFGECEGELHAHHVVTQQQLRKAGLDDRLWDPANGAATCDRHHRRHHNRREPIRESALPLRCLVFAANLDMERFIDRYYA